MQIQADHFNIAQRAVRLWAALPQLGFCCVGIRGDPTAINHQHISHIVKEHHGEAVTDGFVGMPDSCFSFGLRSEVDTLTHWSCKKHSEVLIAGPWCTNLFPKGVLEILTWVFPARPHPTKRVKRNLLNCKADRTYGLRSMTWTVVCSSPAEDATQPDTQIRNAFCPDCAGSLAVGAPNSSVDTLKMDGHTCEMFKPPPSLNGLGRGWHAPTDLRKSQVPCASFKRGPNEAQIGQWMHFRCKGRFELHLGSACLARCRWQVEATAQEFWCLRDNCHCSFIRGHACGSQRPTDSRK